MPETSAEKVNVLLVDDQPGKLIVNETILTNLDVNVIKAHSGAAALSHLSRTDIAVVLLDVSMPETGGFELAEIIRQQPRNQTTAILFLSTVHLSDADRLRGYKMGLLTMFPCRSLLKFCAPRCSCSLRCIERRVSQSG